MSRQVAVEARLRTVVRVCVSFFSMLFVCGLLRAQLSPGELSRAHAELEGSAHCLDCHQSKRGVDADRCLSCHEPLARRIRAGLGLHTGSDYSGCETCHIEHHGREFELVWWGEEGMAAFEHAHTGYDLEGAHARAACRDCHRAENIVSTRELQAAQKDLSRTFLGLDANCLSCHQDEHRGQVAADSCLTCHDLSAWIPARGFDHAETRFPLTGRHREADCSDCHETHSDDRSATDPGFLQFDVAAFASCNDCHQDPHTGRFGSTCESCHSTSGWSTGFDRSAFDHDRARFSLRGAHRAVDCEGCHRPGSGFRVARFDRCLDCHADSHVGQFENLFADRGCPACHATDRFAPAEFSLSDHQQSSYPLVGAHLAVPCISCHRQISLAELQQHLSVTGEAKIDPVRQFRFRDTSCTGCHTDAHGGEVDRWMDAQGCEACHELTGWSHVTFDHELTEFPLRGGHLEVACENCHPRADSEIPSGSIRMTGVSTSCASCHDDPHAGQFSEREVTRCESCHDVDGWSELSFDHDLDSRFPLEGAHRSVACTGCHPVEARDGRNVVRYKPLEQSCESCHG